MRIPFLLLIIMTVAISLPQALGSEVRLIEEVMEEPQSPELLSPEDESKEPAKSPNLTRPLRLGGKSYISSGADRDKDSRKTGGDSENPGLATVLFRIAIYLVGLVGLLVAVGFGVKRLLPGGKQIFSTQAMEVLGRTYLDSKRYLAMVRIGGKVVVLGISPEGMTPVSEITDPEEVTGLLRTARPVTESGRSVFKSLLQGSMTRLAADDKAEKEVEREAALAAETGLIKEQLREMRAKS
jgi:flagellar biogenesis protein FliO